VRHYLGLDFGGTKLAVGLVDENGRVVAFGRSATDPQAGPDGAIAAMRHLVEGFPEGSPRPEAVGISFGGPVDAKRQRALLSHHGPGWDDFPLVERVSSIWQCPVQMDNDANAAALGEARYGAGRGRRNVLYVTVSTGIGAGVILEGQLYRGSHGLSGELGHTIVLPDGPLCPCGKRGCVEAVASGPSMARAYAEAGGIDSEVVSAQMVFERAATGDRTARRVLATAIDLLGIGLANAINLLDPDVVIVGGGVSRAGDAFFVPLREAIRRVSAPSPPDAVPVVPAELGDVGGVLGAVALVAPPP
jgi:glucokinase